MGLINIYNMTYKYEVETKIDVLFWQFMSNRIILGLNKLPVQGSEMLFLIMNHMLNKQCSSSIRSFVYELAVPELRELV